MTPRALPITEVTASIGFFAHAFGKGCFCAICSVVQLARVGRWTSDSWKTIVDVLGGRDEGAHALFKVEFAHTSRGRCALLSPRNPKSGLQFLKCGASIRLLAEATLYTPPSEITRFCSLWHGKTSGRICAFRWTLQAGVEAFRTARSPEQIDHRLVTKIPLAAFTVEALPMPNLTARFDETALRFQNQDWPMTGRALALGTAVLNKARPAQEAGTRTRGHAVCLGAVHGGRVGVYGCIRRKDGGTYPATEGGEGFLGLQNGSVDLG